jgi:hypothetical protein
VRIVPSGRGIECRLPPSFVESLSKVDADRRQTRMSAPLVNELMRTVFCSLLCASLLIHAVLGCCWHDMHDATACDGSLSSLAADACCVQDHDAATDGNGSHAPCKGHPNCHGLCHYLPVQKTNFGKCFDYVLIDFAVDAHATSGSHVSALSFAPGTCEFCPPPPIRLHLFHQILLI